MPRRVTIDDVARLAEVHKATVSRALNARTRDQVNAETLKRVKRAARQLGYVPNAMARGLRTSRSMMHGGRLGVDVPNSGFAFVAYALLEELGVTRGDVEIVALGATPKRAVALRTGGCDVTVLNAGNELTASTLGCVLLTDVTRLGPYIGTVVARMRPATGFHAIERLLGALRETAHGISSGELDGETCAAATSVLGLAASTAGEHLAVLRDPTRGLIPDGSVDAASLGTLVALRRRFLPAPELDDVVERFDDVVRSGVLVT